MAAVVLHFRSTNVSTEEERFFQSVSGASALNSIYGNNISRNPPLAVVEKGGTNAIPWFLKWLETPQRRSVVRLMAGRLVTSLQGHTPRPALKPIAEWAVDQATVLRYRAAMAGFQTLGTNAAAAAPRLRALTTNGTPVQRIWARESLKSIER